MMDGYRDRRCSMRTRIPSHERYVLIKEKRPQKEGPPFRLRRLLLLL